MQFLTFSMRKKPKCFPAGSFFLSCVVDEIFVKVPQFQENFPSLTNYWLLTCTMAYLRVTLRFINLNLVKKLLWTFMLLEPLTYV